MHTDRCGNTIIIIIIIIIITHLLVTTNYEETGSVWVMSFKTQVLNFEYMSHLSKFRKFNFLKITFLRNVTPYRSLDMHQEVQMSYFPFAISRKFHC